MQTPQGKLVVETSGATELRPGQKVQVQARPGDPETERILNRSVGKLLGFSIPHGYAVVEFPGPSGYIPAFTPYETLIHPESLIEVKDPYESLKKAQ